MPVWFASPRSVRDPANRPQAQRGAGAACTHGRGRTSSRRRPPLLRSPCRRWGGSFRGERRWPADTGPGRPGRMDVCSPTPSPDRTSPLPGRQHQRAYYNSAYYKLHQASSSRCRRRAGSAAPELADVAAALILRSRLPAGSRFTPSATPAPPRCRGGPQRGQRRRRHGQRTPPGGPDAPRSSFTSGTWSTTSARASTTTTSSTSRSGPTTGPSSRSRATTTGVPGTRRCPTLQAFLRNFCAAARPRAQCRRLVRSTMTQPGVYFTLDAPFVS